MELVGRGAIVGDADLFVRSSKSHGYRSKCKPISVKLERFLKFLGDLGRSSSIEPMIKRREMYQCLRANRDSKVIK